MLRRGGQAVLQGIARRQGQTEPLWEALGTSTMHQMEGYVCLVKYFATGFIVCIMNTIESFLLLILQFCRPALECSRGVSTLAGKNCLLIMRIAKRSVVVEFHSI